MRPDGTLQRAATMIEDAAWDFWNNHSIPTLNGKFQNSDDHENYFKMRRISQELRELVKVIADKLTEDKHD